MSDCARPTDPGAVWQGPARGGESRETRTDREPQNRGSLCQHPFRDPDEHRRGPALCRSHGRPIRTVRGTAPASRPRRHRGVGRCFRSLVSRPDLSSRSPRPDTAAPGIEYYRRELERRRDHLRNGWLWHGPLFLACIMLAVTLTGRKFLGFDRFGSALPLLAVLFLWTAYSFRRRRLLAKELQREIDDLEHQ